MEYIVILYIPMLTYNVKLTFSCQEEKSRMIQTLEGQRFAFNEASKIKFNKKLKNSIVDLHREFYKEFRANNLNSSADITIQAEKNVCLLTEVLKDVNIKSLNLFVKKDYHVD